MLSALLGDGAVVRHADGAVMRRGVVQVRKGDWKAVSFSASEPFQLYNITADIGEENDLASQFPDVVAELDAIAKAEHTPSVLFPVKDCRSS